MSVQAKLDISTVPLIRHGLPAAVDQEGVLLQDAGRTEGAILTGTVLAFNPTTKKYEPYTNAAATDGTNIPAAIQLNDDISQVDNKAGDVFNFMVLIAGAFIDENQVIFDAAGAITFDTVVTVATNNLKTVRQLLLDLMIISEATIDTSSFEN